MPGQFTAHSLLGVLLDLRVQLVDSVETADFALVDDFSGADANIT
jgi:hypothetical protein